MFKSFMPFSASLKQVNKIPYILVFFMHLHEAKDRISYIFNAIFKNTSNSANMCVFFKSQQYKMTHSKEWISISL